MATGITKLIALHGVGASGDDFSGLADSWSLRIPGLRVQSPDAPFSFDGGGFGRQWFSIAGVTPANRQERVTAARSFFDAVIAEALKNLGAADDASDAAFLGFSQGTIMALDAVASGRWRPAAVLAFSGRLTTPVAAQGGKTKILLTHGGDDQMIPSWESEQAAQSFEKAGYQTALRIEPGLGHGISGTGADNALRFLQSISIG
ncbi:MAG TPA: prolyl oligopeptidase family serine peptidase [Candidatus Sulfotelmatobacter sp.]|jgi:phospholipase/carboxylesterase|nr:prolyl oligopeptidase family serine peptidase [Candidatus Sulfotelmatobacter sp.]